MAVQPVKVLFVCLGNICRSPTAHAFFRHLITTTGLPVEVESAGTIGYHKNNPPDPRTQHIGELRGIDFSGITSQPVVASDFEDYDYILAMDHQNYKDLMFDAPEQHQHKIKLFLSYLNQQDTHSPQEVPDPYYGDESHFIKVVDLVEAGSKALFDHINVTHFNSEY